MIDGKQILARRSLFHVIAVMTIHRYWLSAASLGANGLDRVLLEAVLWLHLQSRGDTVCWHGNNSFGQRVQTVAVSISQFINDQIYESYQTGYFGP